MKWYTHIASATVLALAFTPYSVHYAAAAAILPDVLEKVLGLPHRSVYIHNFTFPLMLLPLAMFSTLSGIFLGVLDHIVLDALTIHGVYLFDKRIHGFMNTNNKMHNLIVIAASIALAYMVI